MEVEKPPVCSGVFQGAILHVTMLVPRSVDVHIDVGRVIVVVAAAVVVVVVEAFEDTSHTS